MKPGGLLYYETDKDFLLFKGEGEKRFSGAEQAYSRVAK